MPLQSRYLRSRGKSRVCINCATKENNPATLMTHAARSLSQSNRTARARTRGQRKPSDSPAPGSPPPRRSAHSRFLLLSSCSGMAFRCHRVPWGLAPFSRPRAAPYSAVSARLQGHFSACRRRRLAVSARFQGRFSACCHRRLSAKAAIANDSHDRRPSVNPVQ